jgi:hypothetical protein
MRVGVQRHAPVALPLGKNRYPLYSRLGGPQGRSERVRKISPPPEFDPRTFQPVASRYTDWTVPAYIACLVRLRNFVSHVDTHLSISAFCMWDVNIIWTEKGKIMKRMTFCGK